MQRFIIQCFPAALGVIIAVWIMREVPPTEVYGIYVLSRFTPPGGDLHLRFTGIRNRACPVISSEEIIDSEGRRFRIVPRLGNPDRETGPFDIDIHLQIPAEAAKGLATFHSIADYGIDPLRGCFRHHVIGPPRRPDARFWIGDSPPPWLTSRARARG